MSYNRTCRLVCLVLVIAMAFTSCWIYDNQESTPKIA